MRGASSTYEVVPTSDEKSSPFWCVGEKPLALSIPVGECPIARPDRLHEVECEGGVRWYSLSGSGECVGAPSMVPVFVLTVARLIGVKNCFQS